MKGPVRKERDDEHGLTCDARGGTRGPGWGLDNREVLVPREFLTNFRMILSPDPSGASALLLYPGIGWGIYLNFGSIQLCPI